jgi:hypothetical protein
MPTFMLIHTLSFSGYVQSSILATLLALNYLIHKKDKAGFWMTMFAAIVFWGLAGIAMGSLIWQVVTYIRSFNA